MIWLTARLWLTRPWRCKLGRHVTREENASYGFGEMTLHCTGCEKGVKRIPFEDLSPEQQEWLSGLMERVPRFPA